MIEVRAETSVTLWSIDAPEEARRALVRFSRDRGAEWSRDEIDALLEEGFVALTTSDGAMTAAVGIQRHGEREDAASVALLWETRPDDALAMTTLIERAARACREQQLVAICAEVDEAQSSDIALFTGLGFAIVEHGAQRLATREELEWMGAKGPLTITTPTTLEYAL